MSQFITSFDSSWLRCRRKLWVWISKKIKIYKIGRLRVSNFTFWVLKKLSGLCHINFAVVFLKMQFYEFSLLSRTEKAIVVHSFVSVASLFSLSIYVSFPPFFSASKKCDFGKTRARSCWWIVTGMILQEYLQTNVWILVLNTLIFHSWPVLPKIQIPRQHWLGTVMTIHYLMVLVSISQPFYLYFSKKKILRHSLRLFLSK